MAPDRLYTGYFRNNARIDNVVFCQSHKILAEMHPFSIFLVQVIRPASSRRVDNRAGCVAAAPRSPRCIATQSRMREFHRRSLPFGPAHAGLSSGACRACTALACEPARERRSSAADPRLRARNFMATWAEDWCDSLWRTS